MNKIKRKRKLLPAWDMPSDPIKAVFWFLHWSLQVLVRFFWILVLIGVIYESILNGRVYGVVPGIVSGIVTLLIGLGVWLGLAIVLFLFNFTQGISKAVGDVNRMQQGFTSRRPSYPFSEPDVENNIVEGTVVTDLDEERRKRRSE